MGAAPLSPADPRLAAAAEASVWAQLISIRIEGDSCAALLQPGPAGM